jgi:hypothetical protein
MDKDIEVRKIELEEKRLQELSRFRDEHLKLQREKLAPPQKGEKKISISPLATTVIAALLGLLGTMVGAYFQGRSNMNLERQKLESSLILKAIETGEPDKAAKNLLFLAKLKLISIPQEQIEQLQKNPEEGPVLPSANKPLPITGNAARQQKFGKFNWVMDSAGVEGNIRILDNWVENNIVEVEIPQLKGVERAPASGKVRFHKNYADQLKKAFAEIEERKLLHLVLSWDGSFAPRLNMRSKTILSNHSFGTAFDINAAYNIFSKVVPAGTKGSVIELVPVFEKYGFYWGGSFKSFPDAAHFEVGEVDTSTPN